MAQGLNQTTAERASHDEAAARYVASMRPEYAREMDRGVGHPIGDARAKLPVKKDTGKAKNNVVRLPVAWLASRLARRDDVGRFEARRPHEGEQPLSLRQRYFDRVERGQIETDPAQVSVVRALDALSEALATYRPTRKGAALGWLLGRTPAIPPRGIYIWGSVGRGKTMLMDLFFEETQISRKKRMHFHAFMADVHARIFAIRQQMKTGLMRGDDPIAPVADAIADEAWLICLDEFSVTDIADAMILGRLFQYLFQRGVVLVATSNVEPDNLYKDGLNRALFLPFIALMQEKMKILELAARTDFRLEKIGQEPVYLTPADAKAEAALTRAFAALTGASEGTPLGLNVLGRNLHVPQAKARVARFGFNDLCAKPLGPRDFLAIAEHFHTVIVDAIPVIRADQPDVAKRFIMFIDALYDQHVKLIASAETEPAGLYLGTTGREAFEFARTISRLTEMHSSEYLALPHGTVSSVASGDSTGLVET
jgi:cell division protein ZapE